MCNPIAPPTSRSKVKNIIPNVHPTNSLILPNGKVFKVQKKRQRKILSCIPCHQRKIKCTRESPTCSNCIILANKNLDKSDEIIGACKYFVNDKKKNLRMDNVLEAHNAIKSINENQACSNELNAMPFDSATIVERQLPIQNEIFINPDTHNSTPKSDVQSSNTPIEQYPKGYESDRKLSYDLIFPSNDQPPQELHSHQKLSIEQQNYSTLNLDMYSQFSNQFSNQFITFIENLPSKERSDELLEIFEKNVYSVLPIIDIEVFKLKYHEFWYCGLFMKDNIEKLYEYIVYFKNGFNQVSEKINDFLYWYNKTNCQLTPSNLLEFYTLLFAIYYTSIVSLVYEYLPTVENSVNSIITYKSEVNQYYQIFQKLNDKWLNHPKVMSLPILQMNILIQSIINLKAGGSLINISKILRICQFYQMNRDPIKFHGLKSKELVQTRRLIWWQILLLDNLVSFFLNLSPLIKLNDFDTSLMIENLNANGENDPTMMYLNCQYRFILILDNLNSSVNGLDKKLKLNDLLVLKKKINDLFLICTNTINKLDHQFNQNVNNQDNFDNYKYFILSMNLLSDKMFIILQKKIILNQIMNEYPNNETNSNVENLNLILNSTNYQYTDLKNNLLPSLIHYIHLFLGLSTKNMMKFNWKIKNYIPIDELILLMQIFATNLNNGLNQQNDNGFNDFSIKVFLIDQTIISFINTWHMKLSSVNKLIGLVSKIWKLMILKNNLNVDYARSISNKFIYPTPIISSDTHEDLPKSFNDSNIQSHQINDNIVVNCKDIIPRGLRMNSISSVNELNSFFSINPVNDLINVSFLDEQVNINIKDTHQQQIDHLINLIEEELHNVSLPSEYKNNNEGYNDGWINLGTEDSTNVSLDDFHFYKNLKIDVIRLFKLVCQRSPI